MHHDAVRHAKIGGGARARGNHRVHPADQPSRPAGMNPLGGGGEDQGQGHAKHVPHDHARQHLGVSPGMPDACRARLGRPPERGECAIGQAGHVGGQDVGPAGGDAQPLRLLRDELDDRRGDARQAPLEVRRENLEVARARSRSCHGARRGIRLAVPRSARRPHKYRPRRDRRRSPADRASPKDR